MEGNSDQLERCRALLSEKELARVDRFKFEQVRIERTFSQGALRMIIGAYLNIAPEKVAFGLHPKGKPFSKDDPLFFFNSSHSGGKCAIAVTRIAEIGIDIEVIRNLNALDDLIDKNFTMGEGAYIGQHKDKKLERFFRFWTLKESYIKAIGEGLRLPPANLEFALENGIAKLMGVNGDPTAINWQFENIGSGSHAGTVCFQGDDVLLKELFLPTTK